jgi:hypothetical protein
METFRSTREHNKPDPTQCNLLAYLADAAGAKGDTRGERGGGEAGGDCVSNGYKRIEGRFIYERATSNQGGL